MPFYDEVSEMSPPLVSCFVERHGESGICKHGRELASCSLDVNLQNSENELFKPNPKWTKAGVQALMPSSTKKVLRGHWDGP